MLTIKKFTEENKKVDYVFGDLTDIPISEAACGELWEFMINILKAAFDILRPSGKFMTHVREFFLWASGYEFDFLEVFCVIFFSLFW